MSVIKRHWEPAHCYTDAFDKGWELIQEFLKPLSINALYYDLKHNWDDSVEIIGDYGTEECPVIKIPSGNINSFEKMKEFKTWLDTRHWMIARDLGREGRCRLLALEKLTSKNVTSKVYKYGEVYHVTSVDRTSNLWSHDKVLTSGGLRPKGPKQTTHQAKEFGKRIYFIYGDKQSLLKCIDKLKKDLVISDEDLRIYKVDLNKINRKIQFYHDPLYDSSNFIYTFTAIPSKYIKQTQL